MTSEMDPIETEVVSYIRQCDPDLFASEGKREVVEHISIDGYAYYGCVACKS